jgi:hypothetical protein
MAKFFKGVGNSLKNGVKGLELEVLKSNRGDLKQSHHETLVQYEESKTICAEIDSIRSLIKANELQVKIYKEKLQLITNNSGTSDNKDAADPNKPSLVQRMQEMKKLFYMNTVASLTAATDALSKDLAGLVAASSGALIDDAALAEKEAKYRTKLAKLDEDIAKCRGSSKT